MSINQNHGFAFENIIKDCHGITGKIPYTNEFDIPKNTLSTKEYQKIRTNISIKTTKNNIVCMGDAVRIFSYNEGFMLIVGRYRQSGGFKVFYEINEYLFDKEAWERMKGSCSEDIVVNYRDSIKSFGKGQHKEARLYCKGRKKILKEMYPSLIGLNHKVDSKTQRRLQCSADLSIIESNCSSVKKYNDFYKDIELPLYVNSTERKFNKRENNE